MFSLKVNLSLITPYNEKYQIILLTQSFFIIIVVDVRQEIADKISAIKINQVPGVDKFNRWFQII